MPEEQMTEQTVRIRLYRVTTKRDTLDKIVGVDISVFNKAPSIAQTAMIMGEHPRIKNMVCAEFMNKADAEEVYYSLQRQGVVVFRNWLDPEGGPESVADGAHGY